jgi:hypothetical protein
MACKHLAVETDFLVLCLRWDEYVTAEDCQECPDYSEVTEEVAREN